METSRSIVDLRKLLTDRFPHLRLDCLPRRPIHSVATGIAVLDALMGGGLPRGEFTELVASGPASGSAAVIHELLCRVAANRQFLALVDGMGSFDPNAAEPAVLTRLLWIQCQQVAEALKATDLLLRDRNFPMLVIDFKLNTARELRKIPGNTWFRYARLLEQNQTTVLVITPQQLVSGAACRVSLESALDLNALAQPRAQLLASLRFKLLRSAAELNREQLAQAG